MSTTVGVPPQGVPQNVSAPPAKRLGNRRLIMIAIGLLALIAAVLWGIRWWTVGRFIESTDDAYLQADSVTVAPKVSGYVTDVYVADNQSVQAGAPLVRLDTRQYQVALDQAQATIDARAADIQRAQADILQQHANIAQAQAQATLAANLAAVASAQTQIAATTAQIAQARAQLEAAKASAQQSRLDLDNTVVRSALAGNVGDRTVRVGQYVQPGTRMLTVVPVQSSYIEANFKETQIGRMRIGQPVTLHVDALPGADLHGTVDSFAPGTGSQFALLPPENATGNFTKIVQRVPVRVRVDTGPETRSVLLPGLSVTVEVDTRSARDRDARIEAENRHG